MNQTPNVQKIIDDRLKSGKYQTSEDVITAGLMTLNQQEHLGDFKPGELDQLLAEADAAIEKGELFDGEAVFKELRELGKNRQSKAE